MPARQNQNAHDTGDVFRLGTAALRKVIGGPLNRRSSSKESAGTAFNTCASQDTVSTVLETDIIPRLMMAHMVDGEVGPMFGQKRDRFAIEATDAESFLPLPLRLEAGDLLKEVDRFLEQGVSVEDVYLDLLAPAAHHLGELWKSDECDFVDVTMGLWRLQEVMREVTRRSPPPCDLSHRARTALFCPIPGDDHSFGAQMIEEVFARASWQSEVLLKPNRRELLDHVARRPLDLVGLTVSSNSPVSALSGLVKAIRSVAVKPNMSVLVGGHMINLDPSLVEAIGADGTGVDAKAALATAERLIPAAPVLASVAT